MAKQRKPKGSKPTNAPKHQPKPRPGVQVVLRVPADGMPSREFNQRLIEVGRSLAGLLVIEPVAVSPDGRITPETAGLWDKLPEAPSPILDIRTRVGRFAKDL